jgi:hypothetical protein
MTAMDNMTDRKSFAEYIRRKGLEEDPNFHLLAIYYSTLKEGGDGELEVRLLRGKITIKGATYLKKVVSP